MSQQLVPEKATQLFSQSRLYSPRLQAVVTMRREETFRDAEQISHLHVHKEVIVIG